MSLRPMYKRCPRCKREYSWNPDVGNMACPYCSFSILGSLASIVGKSGRDLDIKQEEKPASSRVAEDLAGFFGGKRKK